MNGKNELIRIRRIPPAMMIREAKFVKVSIPFSRNFLGRTVIDFATSARKQMLSVCFGRVGGKLNRGALAASGMPCALTRDGEYRARQKKSKKNLAGKTARLTELFNCNAD